MVVEYLVLGGGGGGGMTGTLSGAGGGGGGGVLSGSVDVSGAYAITVGGGGAGATNITTGGAGGNSYFGGLVGVNGGGGGGCGEGGANALSTAGATGGCGGGGGGSRNAPLATIAGGGAYHGYGGGTGIQAIEYGGGGGGGGMGGGGGPGTRNDDAQDGTWPTVGGAGGGAIGSSISGVFNGYGAGGGGGGKSGAGGGGYGAGYGAGLGGAPGAGAAYSGGGGGGGGAQSNYGAAGGSGIVIIRYAGGQMATGGSITSSGGYTIHTFYSSGTFTVTPPAPTISAIDTLTGTGPYDITIVRGTTQYTHVWGTGLTPTTNGTVSGSGVTAPFAADGGPTLIALNITATAGAALGNRTLTVSNANGTSNGVTITIIAPPPTFTGIGTIGGGGARAFIGIKQRITITGTNFVAPVTLSGPGLTFTNVSVVSETQINADVLASGLGDQPVTVTAAGGASGTRPLTVLAVTSIANPGMIVNHILGTAHNTHIGPLGFQFTVGPADRKVTHLGRFKWGTNTRKHTLTLRDVTTLQEVARAVIDLGAQGASDEWTYVALSAPVVLKANQRYLLSDYDCWYGGDYWANISPLATDGRATVNGVEVEASSMNSFVKGANRSDSYAAGLRFTNNGYQIRLLGRWKNPGNSLAHRVVLKDAAGTILRSVIVDFTGGKGIDNQFNYVAINPIAVVVGAVYYVLSDEPGGSEIWTAHPNTITPWGGLTMTGGAYEAYPATSGVVPASNAVANTMENAVDVVCLAANPAAYAEGYVTLNLKWEASGQPMAMLI